MHRVSVIGTGLLSFFLLIGVIGCSKSIRDAKIYGGTGTYTGELYMYRVDDAWAPDEKSRSIYKIEDYSETNKKMREWVPLRRKNDVSGLDGHERVVTQTDTIKINLRSVFLKYFKEYGKGEIAFIISFANGEKIKENLLIYASTGQTMSSSLALDDVTIVGPEKMTGSNLRMRIIMIEVDRIENEVSKNVIKQAAGIASLIQPQYATVAKIGSEVAQMIISMNEDDVIFDRTFELSLTVKGQTIEASPLLFGQYVLLLQEDRFQGNDVSEKAKIATRSPAIDDMRFNLLDNKLYSTYIYRPSIPMDYSLFSDYVKYRFTDDEFKDSTYTIKELCDAFPKDAVGADIKASKHTLPWLNELLDKKDLYEKMRESNNKKSLSIEYSAAVLAMAMETQEIRQKADQLTDKEKSIIGNFNRLVVEQTYPKKSPKIADRFEIDYERTTGERYDLGSKTVDFNQFYIYDDPKDRYEKGDERHKVILSKINSDAARTSRHTKLAFELDDRIGDFDIAGDLGQTLKLICLESRRDESKETKEMCDVSKRNYNLSDEPIFTHFPVYLYPKEYTLLFQYPFHTYLVFSISKVVGEPDNAKPVEEKYATYDEWLEKATKAALDTTTVNETMDRIKTAIVSKTVLDKTLKKAAAEKDEKERQCIIVRALKDSRISESELLFNELYHYSGDIFTRKEDALQKYDRCFSIKPEFSDDEFKTVTALCSKITGDGLGVGLAATANTVSWLNELLTVPGLYEQIKAKHSDQKYSQAVNDLVDATKDYRPKAFAGLSSEEQGRIKELNRRLIDEIYKISPMAKRL